MKTTNSLFSAFGCLLIISSFFIAPQISKAQANPDLTYMVLHSDSKALSDALINGNDVDKQTKAGNTALIAAAKIGDKRVISTLLSNNADVNIRNGAGATALMLAAKYGNSYAVTALLKHGADPTIENNNGYTAANFAFGYKHQEIYKQLKEAEKNFIPQRELLHADNS